MSRFLVIFIGLLSSSFLAFAQYEEDYCEGVYENWVGSSGFIESPEPEIEGGLSSLHKKLIYPDSAIVAGLEESAKVWLIVSKKGSPECIRFVELENEVFKPFILTAIKKQKFKPIVINDSSLDAPMIIPFNFRLE